MTFLSHFALLNYYLIELVGMHSGIAFSMNAALESQNKLS